MRGELDMSKLVIAAAAALIVMVGSVRADQDVYVLENWPNDINQIPCSAWKKSPDGSWVLQHAAVKVGASELEDVAVKGDAAARMVERLCGAKSK
jgi:hypothetical protein